MKLDKIPAYGITAHPTQWKSDNSRHNSAHSRSGFEIHRDCGKVELFEIGLVGNDGSGSIGTRYCGIDLKQRKAGEDSGQGRKAVGCAAPLRGCAEGNLGG